MTTNRDIKKGFHNANEACNLLKSQLLSLKPNQASFANPFQQLLKSPILASWFWVSQHTIMTKTKAPHGGLHLLTAPPSAVFVPETSRRLIMSTSWTSAAPSKLLILLFHLILWGIHTAHSLVTGNTDIILYPLQRLPGYVDNKAVYTTSSSPSLDSRSLLQRQPIVFGLSETQLLKMLLYK